MGIVGAGRVGTRSRARPSRRRRRGRGPAGRGERPARCDAIVLCVPDAEIAAAAEVVTAAAPLVGHTSGATPLPGARPTPAPGLRPPPAPVLRPSGACASRRRRGRGGLDARGARVRHRARGAARHEAVRDRRRGPRRLPRRRLRGLELPGHARGRRRDDRAGAGLEPRAGARAARCRSCARRSRTSPSSAPRRRSPGRSPAATRPRSRRSAPPSRRVRRAARPVRRAGPPHARARGPRGAGMRTVRTVAELRELLAPSGAPAARSGSCPPWATSTTATCR